MRTIADRAFGGTLTDLAAHAHPGFQALLTVTAVTGHIFGGKAQLFTGILCRQPPFMNLIPVLGCLENRTFFTIQTTISQFSHLAPLQVCTRSGCRKVF